MIRPGAAMFDDSGATKRGTGDDAGRVRPRLERLVTRGHLTAEQADIVAAELAGDPADRGGTRRRAVLVETVGYVGAALVLAAVALLGEALWAELAPWARTLLLALTAGLLWAAGRWVCPPGTVGPADRLGGTLGALSTGACAGAAAVAASWAGVAAEDRALLVGVVALVPAAWWWRARPAALQLVVLFAAAGTAAVGLMLVLDPDLAWTWALLVTAFGLAWTTLVWGGVLGPARTGYVLGAVTTAAGPQIAVGDAEIAAPAIGLALAVALIVASITVHQSALAVVGTVATTGYLLELTHRLLPGELGWMAGMLVAGAALLAGSLTTLRTARPGAPPPGGASDE